MGADKGGREDGKGPAGEECGGEQGAEVVRGGVCMKGSFVYARSGCC